MVPVAKSQSFTVLSSDGDAISLSFSEMAKAYPPALSMLHSVPVAISQILIVESYDADASCVPFDKKVTKWTPFE